MRIHAISLSFFLLVTACAGFESKPIMSMAPGGTKKEADDGIVYYMPLKPIIVQVALDNGGNMTITTQTASAIPDRSRPFLLTVPPNYLSENHATISVGTNGLLQSAASGQTSGVDAAVKSIATDLGTITGLAGGMAPGLAPVAPTPCQNLQTYSRVIWPEDVAHGTPILPICNLTITVQKLGGESPVDNTARATDYTNAQSGVFYKAEIPYLVTVKASPVAPQGQTFIAYSSDEAPIQFAPLQRSFFANNTTTITLTDGLLSKSESDVSGEITGLVALPADAISAYTTAIGNIFSSLNTRATNQNTLAVSDAQRQLCRIAIAANPIPAANAAQTATNYANIKTACGGS